MSLHQFATGIKLNEFAPFQLMFSSCSLHRETSHGAGDGDGGGGGGSGGGGAVVALQTSVSLSIV